MSLSLDIQKTEDAVSTKQYDVVVVGAGPYGLSAAAHLQAQNLSVAVFGKPIHFWREHMPQGMLLRSYWWASNLSDPEKKYSTKHYFQAKGIEPSDPLPIETYIDYALWFQKNAVPDVDETYVSTIERKNGQFVLTLEDDRVIRSKTVVMAPGLQYYKYIPKEYVHMPSHLVSHSSEHRILSKFAGKEIAVIGGGQAAIETSALLNESRAKVHLVTRSPLRWIPSGSGRLPVFLRELRTPRAGMGNGWLNRLLENYPYVFQRLPRNTKEYVLETRNGPAGSPWLKSRVIDKIQIHEQQTVSSIEELDGRVCITFASGEKLVVDHVILATGYKTDIRRLTMLEPMLRVSIRTYKKAPMLSTWFETNISGLFFIGFTAARTFGPYYRFVIGDEAAARRVTQAVARLVASRR